MARDAAEVIDAISFRRMPYPCPSRHTRNVDFMAEYNDETGNRPIAPIDQAAVITSEDQFSERHYPVLDLDYHARLIPSSTPDHYHLYLDRPVDWGKFVVVLDAMADAGLLEDGYVKASKERKYTCVRLPWVGKADVKGTSGLPEVDRLAEAIEHVLKTRTAQGFEMTPRQLADALLDELKADANAFAATPEEPR